MLAATWHTDVNVLVRYARDVAVADEEGDAHPDRWDFGTYIHISGYDSPSISEAERDLYWDKVEVYTGLRRPKDPNILFSCSC